MKLHHINIMVPNLEEAVSYYKEILGFKEVARFSGNMTFVFVSDGKVTYELIEDSSLTQGFFDHIAYQSDDIENDFRKYEEMGITTTTLNTIPYLFSNGVKYFFIKGSTGEKIEFCQEIIYIDVRENVEKY